MEECKPLSAGQELTGEVVRTVVNAYTLVPAFDPPLTSQAASTGSATDHALDVLHTVVGRCRLTSG